MNENIYRRAPVPLYYPLVFLLNIALIIALEILLVYRQPLPITDASLSDILPKYQNASIQTSAESSTIIWYLAETEEAQLYLIPIRKHILFSVRGKLLKDQITSIAPDTAETEIVTRAGISGSAVHVGTEVEPREDEPTGERIQLRSKYHKNYAGSTGTYTISGYFLLGVLLSVLESLLWNKIKGTL